jgi:hypothetical protein
VDRKERGDVFYNGKKMGVADYRLQVTEDVKKIGGRPVRVSGDVLAYNMTFTLTEGNTLSEKAPLTLIRPDVTRWQFYHRLGGGPVNLAPQG